MNDFNRKVIDEFRANEGRVGGNFEGAPVVLVHHRGRTSGRDYVNPMMYLPDDNDPDKIYVFATKAGAPTNPDWYYNLIAASEGTIERGTDTYSVTVHELTGKERVIPLVHTRDGDRVVVIASKGGAPAHPTGTSTCWRTPR